MANQDLGASDFCESHLKPAGVKTKAQLTALANVAWGWALARTIRRLVDSRDIRSPTHLDHFAYCPVNKAHFEKPGIVRRDVLPDVGGPNTIPDQESRLHQVVQELVELAFRHKRMRCLRYSS